MSEIITGDCLEELEQLDENSVEAIVTDPPYGLAFMGRDWDDFKPKEYQEWCQKWAEKAKDVLKPGGHMLAFSGNRTHHRLFTGVEDAGYEIRDTITWHYGSGFPKALDVSKAIDKAGDAEREVIDTPRQRANSDGSDVPFNNSDGDVEEITAPATDAAERWDGFKTALKPATEYVVVARKSLSEGTVAENVQTHGTGALNIDGTRIETDGRPKREAKSEHSDGDTLEMGTLGTSEATGETTEGRYPSNVIFDETEAERLDREKGETCGSNNGITRNKDIDSGDPDIHEGYDRPNKTMFADDEPDGIRSFGDSGGPSRYFYTSKATKAERTLDGKIDNSHPTVKPVDLMEWLVTLVTAKEQTVLDPFCGSGTTGIACKNKNREFIGIEQNEEYADIARARMGLDVENPDVLRSDDEQQGLESF